MWEWAGPLDGLALLPKWNLDIICEKVLYGIGMVCEKSCDAWVRGDWTCFIVHFQLTYRRPVAAIGAGRARAPPIISKSCIFSFITFNAES